MHYPLKRNRFQTLRRVVRKKHIFYQIKCAGILRLAGGGRLTNPLVYGLTILFDNENKNLIFLGHKQATSTRVYVFEKISVLFNFPTSVPAG